MAALASFLLPVLLCGVCSHGTTGLDLKVNTKDANPPLISRMGADENLNKMATDVVQDVIQVLVPYAKKRDESQGPPPTPSLYDVIDIAGIPFYVTSEKGALRGFPTLQAKNETQLGYIMYLSPPYLHLVNMEIPITFKTFEIDYDKMTIKNGNQTWTGKLSLKVKSPVFELRVNIKHSGPAEPATGEVSCTVEVAGVRVFQYSDSELDIKFEGFPEQILKHLESHRSYNAYLSRLLREAFDLYLSPPNPPPFPVKSGLLRYCTYRPSYPNTPKRRGVRVPLRFF